MSTQYTTSSRSLQSGRVNENKEYNQNSQRVAMKKSDCTYQCSNYQSNAGTSTQVTACISPYGIPLPRSNCNLQRDVDVIDCNKYRCSGSYFKVGPWRGCKSDSGGNAKRSVKCVKGGYHDRARPSKSCAKSQPRPPSKKACPRQRHHLEDVYYWWVSDWGSCHSHCLSQRQTECKQVGSTGPVAKSLCQGLPQPRILQGCSDCELYSQFYSIRDIPMAKDVVDINGAECLSGSTLDGDGLCCASGQVDACGVCDGDGKYVAADGACCSTVLGADMLCCETMDLDVCGVCGGLGTTCDGGKKAQSSEGNNFCEIGEIFGQPSHFDDCQLRFKECPVGIRSKLTSGPVCSGNGRCLIASGACDCFIGYTGDACEMCDQVAGFYPNVQGTQCVCQRSYGCYYITDAGNTPIHWFGRAVASGVIIAFICGFFVLCKFCVTLTRAFSGRIQQHRAFAWLGRTPPRAPHHQPAYIDEAYDEVDTRTYSVIAASFVAKWRGAGEGDGQLTAPAA